MQISNALGGLAPPPKTNSSAQPALAPSAQTTASDPTQAFLDYMKETPAQRLEDSWLASHHLTRKALEAMSPEKRAAIEKQMAEDIKRQLKQATEDKSRVSTNILV